MTGMSDDTWITHYRPLLYDERNKTTTSQTEDYNTISVDDVKVKNMKTRKASGIDNIQTEFMKYGGMHSMPYCKPFFDNLAERRISED